MSKPIQPVNYRPAVILGLAMALGPLAALSLGTRYADEETWARAQAGHDESNSIAPIAEYGPSGPTMQTPDYASGKSLADVLSGSGVFDSFKTAMAATDLGDEIAGGGMYTVFVPSDEALSNLPADERAALVGDKSALTAQLSKHIVPGRYTAIDLMRMEEARTLDGTIVSVGASNRYNGQVGIGGAEIVKTNLFANNGIVHVVNGLIR